MKLSDVYILVTEAAWPGYWGKGRTVQEAMKAARFPKHYFVYAVHPETWVDGMGSMSYPTGHEPLLIDWKMTKAMEKKIESVIKESTSRPSVTEWKEEAPLTVPTEEIFP